MGQERYDLTGVRGAENFRELEPGLLLDLADGCRAEILENAGDGAVVLVTIVNSPADASRVGGQEVVFYKEVLRVIEDGRDD